MKRRITILTLSLLAVLIITVFLVINLSGIDQSEDSCFVKRGELVSSIECIGEVKGGSSTPINMPDVLRDWSLRVYQYKITDLVQDGKMLNKGDYVLKLDESGLANNMKTRMQEKEKHDAELKHAVLDSTVKLTTIREEIKNLLLDLEYEKIDLEQSKYESGAYQRKAEMSYKKAEIALEKKRRDYLLEQHKLRVQIMRHEEQVNGLQRRIDKYQEAIRATRIMSPGAGLVMFEKDYSGKNYTKDSQVYMYMEKPIAVLPDMSTVICLAKIKEIDITKIHLNDSVRISVDALPQKEFTGRIVKIANMGEEHKNFDMKVFEVKIQFDFSDAELKPGMTCNNEIIYRSYKDALLVPLEAVFEEGNKSFVYVKEGSKVIKQLVKTGGEDDKSIVILEGLEEGDKILKYKPQTAQLAVL